MKETFFCTVFEILRKDQDLLEEIGAQSTEESPWKKKKKSLKGEYLMGGRP